MSVAAASPLQMTGAGCFGAVVGWYLYYINRYRGERVQLKDLVTLVGVLAGSGVVALFPARTDLFGAYGIGLALGFFSYLVVLLVLVRRSENFDLDWFLDGRRKRPQDPFFVPAEVHPTATAMAADRRSTN
jgi:hypothetical protein